MEILFQCSPYPRTMNRKLITFNCRGLQDYTKRRKLFHYLRSIESDIIFLQETHSSKNDELPWKQQWGEKAWFCSHTSNSRGVAILIRNNLSVVLDSVYSDPDGRVLIISASIDDVPLILVNVYGPNHDNPDFFLEVFSKVDKLKYASIICAGDFNIVMGRLDYRGGRDTHTNIKASNMLSTLVEEFNLCDVWRSYHPNLKQYTRHQKNPQVLSRLDFILVSDNFVSNCVQSKDKPHFRSKSVFKNLGLKNGQRVVKSVELHELLNQLCY